MKTQNEVAKELKISTMTVRNRADDLGFKKRYAECDHSQPRVFNDEEFAAIRDYVPKKWRK